MSVERELRKIEQQEKRVRRPGEKEKLKQKWIEGANRVDKSKLSEIWEDEKTTDKGYVKGYFTGITFDENGRIIK